jgi:hypothetical protein
MIPVKLDDATRRAAALCWVQALVDASGQPLLFVFTPPKGIVDTPAHLWYVTFTDTAEPVEVRTGEVVRPGDRCEAGLPVPAVCSEPPLSPPGEPPAEPPPPPPTPAELLACECPLRLLAWEHGLGWCRHFHLLGGGARVHCYGQGCVPPEGALPTRLQAAFANHEREGDDS